MTRDEVTATVVKGALTWVKATSGANVAVCAAASWLGPPFGAVTTVGFISGSRSIIDIMADLLVISVAAVTTAKFVSAATTVNGADAC
jgi:hypothetical protein